MPISTEITDINAIEEEQ